MRDYSEKAFGMHHFGKVCTSCGQRQIEKKNKRMKTLYIAPREPFGDNYFKKLSRELAAGRLPLAQGEVNFLTVVHDDWCAFWEGGICDCDPELSVRPQAPEEVRE